jgi:hypothetical protein
MCEGTRSAASGSSFDFYEPPSSVSRLLPSIKLGWMNRTSRQLAGDVVYETMS